MGREELIESCKKLYTELENFELDEKIEIINELRSNLSSFSPFSSEPIDCVQWVPSKIVTANTYNPNRVAPPEMKLLELSILSDGYTQPIVTFPENEKLTVVDGFHRTRIGKECNEVKEKLHEYLPVVIINDKDLDDRMASTIRHNRARGKHQVDAMTDIVLELSRRNWNDKKIAKELGMDQDEVLRFKQIGGLSSLFTDKDFSEAWEIED